MMTGRSLRICALGNANSVAVQIRTRCFARRGHQVVILSPVSAAVRDLEVLAPTPGHATAIRRVVSYLQMIRLLRRWRPDVLLVHFASLPFNWLLPLVWFKPFAVSLMGGDILFHQRPDLSPRRRRATLELLEIADCVISRSDYMLASHPRLQAKALVTPWGIDLSEFSDAQPAASSPLTRAALGLAEDTPLIVSPRRIVPICGVASIVEAMADVRVRVPDAVLLVTDDQPDPDYRRHVLELIERLGIGDGIRWINAIDHEDMPDLYRVADVTVSVARSDGISSTVLESMASRTPVVLGDIPNYAGVFADREHCRMVDPHDPRSIAAGITDILTDPGLRQAIVEKASAKVGEYADLAREAARVEATLCDVVGSRSRSLRLPARARHALNLALLAVEPDSAR
jgi:glycosyltransferase involved in cell wall biosynthesis